MTRLHDAIAALVEPGEESLLRDQPSVRARRAELDKEHRDHIAYLRQRHAAARVAAVTTKSRSLAARNAAGMRRAITAMTEAGQAHRTRRAALIATDGGTPSLLEQLEDAVHGTGGTNGASGAGANRSPIGLAAAELLHDIRRTIGHRGEHLAAALATWADVVDDDGGYTSIATTWVQDARAILHPSRWTEARAACPSCGNRHVWIVENGERTRRAAIAINLTEGYAHCLVEACGATWDRNHFDLLAALLRQDIGERVSTRAKREL